MCAGEHHVQAEWFISN